VQLFEDRQRLETEFLLESAAIQQSRIPCRRRVAHPDMNVRIQALHHALQVIHNHRLTRRVIYGMLQSRRTQQHHQRLRNIVDMNQQKSLRPHVRQHDLRRDPGAEKFENFTPPSGRGRARPRPNHAPNPQTNEAQRFLRVCLSQLLHVKFRRAVDIFRRRPILLRDGAISRAGSVNADRTAEDNSLHAEASRQFQQLETPRDIDLRRAQRLALRRRRQNRSQVNDAADPLRLEDSLQLRRITNVTYNFVRTCLLIRLRHRSLVQRNSGVA